MATISKARKFWHARKPGSRLWFSNEDIRRQGDGRFDKADFIYDPEKNEFRCPAGQALIWRFASIEKGMTNPRFWSSNCQGCLLKNKCTPSRQRRVTRWEHQDVLEDMQTRLDQNPDAMRIRRSSVKRLYGPSNPGWERRIS